MDERYYAKSRRADGTQVTVSEHVSRVAELAGAFGAAFGREAEGRVSGLTHDFGKCGQQFQEVLQGTCHGIDHAFSSAAWLYSQSRRWPRAYEPLIEAVNAHHSALAPLSELETRFQASLDGKADVTGSDHRTAALCGGEYQQAAASMERAIPGYIPGKLSRFQCSDYKSDYIPNLEQMLYTRFLFSCLVDADYTVSAAEEDEGFPDTAEQTDFDPAAVLERLNQYRAALSAGSTAEAGLNRLRDEVFDQCGRMGAQAPGLFTLTAPTGTGKTLALLHFALRHCLAHGMRRIIFVLPYLTLTEQNAGTYRDIIPDLLEDHSQSRLSEAQRIFAQRWSVPVIVTTSVRFFETLFASRPTDCRKLHSIARSVILFDEAQTLPIELTEATLRAAQELCRRYRSTVVLSTATQPNYAAISGLPWKPTEILPRHPALFRQLRRTRVDWRLKESTALEDIAAELARRESVCAIVNLRRHARKLYDLLTENCEESTCFYLTTDLCAAHRSRVVEQIQSRLRAHLPCRVVATQCIEAGVDLDFDAVYRALAPLEAVIQAAGRCNRNGRLPEGEVVVFIPAEKGELYPRNSWYKLGAEKVATQHRSRPIDIHDPDHIADYYRYLFSMERATRKKELYDALKARDYQAVDRAYRLIDEESVRIIVPFSGEQESYDALSSELRQNGMVISPAQMRQAAPITVSSIYREQVEQVAEKLCFPQDRRNKNQTKRTESGWYLLCAQHLSCYDSEKLGFQPDRCEEKNDFLY